MSDKTYLEWPFFNDEHRVLAANLDEWAARNLTDVHHTSDVDETCRALVDRLGKAGWLRHAVPRAFGGVHDRLDSRSLCLVR